VELGHRPGMGIRPPESTGISSLSAKALPSSLAPNAALPPWSHQHEAGLVPPSVGLVPQRPGLTSWPHEHKTPLQDVPKRGFALRQNAYDPSVLSGFSRPLASKNTWNMRLSNAITGGVIVAARQQSRMASEPPSNQRGPSFLPPRAGMDGSGSRPLQRPSHGLHMAELDLPVSHTHSGAASPDVRSGSEWVPRRVREPAKSTFVRHRREATSLRDMARERSPNRGHSWDMPTVGGPQIGPVQVEVPDPGTSFSSKSNDRQSEEGGFKGVEPLARALIEKCGSLERAFSSFDYNRKKKVTRTQWETGILVLHLDCEDLCGISAKRLFKMMETMDGPGTGAVTLENWTRFFEQLEGTDAASLLKQDLGKWGGRMLKSRSGSKHCDFEFDGDAAGIQVVDDARPEFGGPADSAMPSGFHSLGRDIARRACVAESLDNLEEESSLGRRDRASAISSTPHGNDASSVRYDLPGMSGHLEVESVMSTSPHGQIGSPTSESPDTQPMLGRRGTRRRRSCRLSDSGYLSGSGHLSGGGQTPRSGDPLESLPKLGVEQATRHTPAASSRSRSDNCSMGSGDHLVARLPLISGLAPQSSEVDHASGVSGQAVQMFSGRSDDAGEIVDFDRMESPSAALKGALAGCRKSMDQLADDELDALAEQQQLESEVQQLDLTGIEALAYVLVAKCGSLKKAFRWFDSNRKGQVAQVVWDTGMLLLRIDTERLTGLKPSAIFSMIDNDPRDGLITRSEWRKFFGAVDNGNLAELLKKAAGDEGGNTTLADRAAARKDALKRQKVELNERRRGGKASKDHPMGARRKGSKDRRNVGGEYAVSDVSEGDGYDRGEAQRSDLAPQCSRRAHHHETDHNRGGGAASGGSCDSTGLSNTAADGLQDECLRRHAVSAVGVDADAARLRGVDAKDLEQRKMDFRERIRQDLSSLAQDMGTELTEGFTDWQLEIVVDIANELDLFSASVPGGVFVCNCKEFADETREDLLGMALGDNLEFPSSLSTVRRKVVHLLVAELDWLLASNIGSGEDQRVAVFYLDDFAEELRRILYSLRPGESKQFPTDFSQAHQRLVRIFSDELGLWIAEEGLGEGKVCLEVFNLASFANEVRTTLMPLQVGEQHTFPAKLTEQQRKVVQYIAAELGFLARTLGEEATRAITVAHLGDFKLQTRQLLEQLGPGASHTFGAELTSMQRIVVQEIAAELSLVCSSQRQVVDSVLVVTSIAKGRSGAGRGGRKEGEAERGGSGGSTGSAGPEDASKTGANDGRQSSLSVMETEEDEDYTLDAEQSTESLLSRLFYRYATGSHKGEKIFLRFPDLRKFAEEAKGLAPEAHRMFCQFEGVLESTFDDTIQLQSDMGIRTTKGLTLQWFSVFVQKALTRLGMQIVSLLMGLLGSRK